MIIVNILLHKPAKLWLREVQEELLAVYGIDVCESTLCMF